MPNYSTVATALQQLLYEKDDSDKWYSGDAPTESEILAKIYTVYGADTKSTKQYFSALNLLHTDKSSPLYNPYTAATNSALRAISDYGVDTSRGITDDWIQEYSYLKNYYRVGEGGTPLAPSAKSSNEENAAYYYYKILKSEETTRKAETEWAALQEEINYWAARTDRNYSDQQILDKIDWSKYSTLTALDEDKNLGTPTSLNRAIDYSTDVLSGVVWGARNKSTGNVFVDSVQAALGAGRQYRQDADIAAKLDPTSDQFNPYSVGSTADAAMLYFGISSADDDWLTKNRGILSSGDKTAINYYQTLFDARQFTKQAESELERLYADIDEYLLTSSDPDRIIDNLLTDSAIRSTEKYGEEGYPTLRKLDSSLKSGELYNTSGAIDYRWSDVEQYIRDRCEEINAEKAEILRVKSENSVTEIKNEIINSAGDTIKYVGTDGEKDAFNFTYSANFNEYVNAIKAEIDNGKMTGGATYEYALGRANEYAAKNYMALKDTVAKYESAQAELAEAQAGLAEAEKSGENMLALDSDVTRMNIAVSENTAYLEKNKAKYEKALQGITAIEEAYTAANEIGDIVGGDISDGIVPVMNFAYEYGSEYIPTEWSPQTIYDAAIEAGYSFDEVSAIAEAQLPVLEENIKTIDFALSVLKENKVQIDGSYINNLNRRKSEFIRDTKDAQYLLLQNEQDFESKSSEYAQKVKDAWKGYNPLVTFNNKPILGTGSKEGFSYLSLCMVDITKSLGQNYAAAMTEAERNTYLYLADTQGEEAAQEYYTHLTDATYGAVIVRQSQKFGEIVQDFADQNAIGATVLSIVASPLQISGTIYAAGTAIAGNEINPYNPAFSMTTLVQGSRETVKANITESLGEGTFGAFAANLAYDIGTTSADSLTSAYLGGSAIGGTLLMSGEATAAVIQYAKQRGATDEQALSVGGIAFAAEFATEIIPQTLMRKAFRAGAAGNVSAFKKIIAADITSGTLGEMLAELIEGTSDTLIMGELSQREQRVNSYIDQGMTAEEAEKQANWDFFYEIGYAGLVGLFAEGTGQVSAFTAGKISSVFKPTQKNTPPSDNAPVEPENGPNLNDNIAGANIQTEVETPAGEQAGNGQGQVEAESPVVEPVQAENVASVEPPAEINADLSEESEEIQRIFPIAYDRARTDTITRYAAKQIADQIKAEGRVYSAGSLANAIMALSDATTAENFLSGVKEIAADLATDNSAVTEEYSEIKQILRDRVFRLSDAQRSEAKNSSDGMRRFMNSIVGKTKMRNDAQITLDQLWPELNDKAPNLFEADIAETDMPRLLTEALDTIYAKGKPDPKAQQEYLEFILSAIAISEKPKESTVRSLAALGEALMTNDLAGQAAAVAASLEESSADTDAAVAASKALIKQHGARTVVKTMRDIKKLDVPGAELAVMAAALSQDAKANAALNTLFLSPTTKRNINALINAAKGIADRGAMQAAITDSMVSERVKELVGAGKLQGLQSLQASLSQSRQNLTESQAKLEQAQRDYDISGENAQIANAQFIQNPSAPELRNRVSQAVNELKGKAIVVQQMQESVEKYTTQLAAADKMLKSARNNAMKDVRQQAMDEVKQAQTEREAGIKAAILREAVMPEPMQEVPLFAKASQRGTEPAGRTRTAAPAQVVSPVETAVQLADALGIGKTISTRKMNRFPSKVKGYYLERARHMAIRSGNSSDFTITMHELGHAVSERLGMVGTDEMISNLPGMFADQYSADALPKESFAEFFWRYIEDEGTARAFAGDPFYNNFEREMKRAGIYDAVAESRDRIQTYNSVSTIEQTKARLVDASKKTYSKDGILDTLHNRLRNFEAGTFNWTAFARDIDKQITKQGGKAAVETLLQMRNFSARQAGNMLKNPLFDPTGRYQIAGSFADTLAPYITPQTFEDYNAYLILLHSLDMDALNIEVLNTPRADRQAAVAEMEQANPEFKEARAALSEWWDALMTAYMVEPGLLSAETYAEWKKQNPNYVPQRRLVGSAPSVGTSADSGNIFKKRLGSDLDIIMPIDSLMNYLPRIVAEMRKVRAKQEFHLRYQDTPGLGLWARPVTPDAVESSVSTEGIRELLEKTLLDKADPDALATVFDKLGERWSEWRMTKDTSLPNVMDVPLPDGETVLYQIDDPNVFDMFMGNNDNIPAVPTGFRYLGKFTKLLQRMYTSASPAFLVSNPLNDVIEATVNSTFATTTFDAVAKAVPQMIDIYRKQGRFQNFMALGGGGWHRVDVGTERGISDYRNEVMKKYWRSSAKEVGKAAVQTVGDVLTIEPVQEANENMFRYLEFLSKNYDRSTEIGNYEAFVAGQNVSTNFAGHGRSKTVAILRTMVPFLNPALQGTYRDARAMTGDRRGKVIAKLVFNGLLLRGLALVARKAFFDDDDKEYETLPAEIKMSNVIFPNIFGEDAPDWMTAADRRFIRIPMGRSPLAYLASGTATALIDYADGKDDIGTQAIMMAAAFADDLTFGVSSIFTTSGELKERFNSLMQGTVAASLWGVSTNQTYFGDSIENVGMSYLPQSLRYNDYTSSLAKSIGGALNVSPVQLDYLIQQTFGVGGQVILDSIDKGGNVLQSVADTIAKRLTIDPSYSNDITDMYYADRQTLNQLVQGGTRMDSDGGLLNPGLTDTERKNAFEEAKALIAADGTFGQIDKAITTAWDKINEVVANDTLTAKEKRLLTRDIRDQIVALEFSAHQTMGEFNAKYVSGNSSLIELMQPQELVPYNALEKLSEVFTGAYNDGNPVMTNLVELWQETGLDKYLPTPRASDISKEVPDDKLEDWDAAYWDGFSSYIGAHISGWDGLTEEEKAKIISSAKSSGTTAAKNWYEKLKSLQD
jgi:hypothetical protein